MSTNLKFRAGERQRKRESSRQASEVQREIKGRQRSRARYKKQRRHFLLEEQHENFVAAVIKWEMLAATNARWKWAAVKKSEQEHVYEISPIKLVTKKFLEVSRCSRAKQRQRNVQNSVLHVQHRPIVVFPRSAALPSPLSITRFYILFEGTINTIESFAFSLG